MSELRRWDAYTQGHSDRVSLYAVTIARSLGLSRDAQQEIALAGELHDVGKTTVPLAILNKPGRLTGGEYRRLMAHTVVGERMLEKRYADRPTVLAVARWHHERIDGWGTPDGLRGQEIPLAARIVAVADAFDAMTSSRPYRPALARRVAIRELQVNSGKQFDPACVSAFVAVLRRRAQGRGGVPIRAFRRSMRRAWFGCRRGEQPHQLAPTSVAGPAGQASGSLPLTCRRRTTVLAHGPPEIIGEPIQYPQVCRGSPDEGGLLRKPYRRFTQVTQHQTDHADCANLSALLAHRTIGQNTVDAVKSAAGSE